MSKNKETANKTINKSKNKNKNKKQKQKHNTTNQKQETQNKRTKTKTKAFGSVWRHCPNSTLNFAVLIILSQIDPDLCSVWCYFPNSTLIFVVFDHNFLIRP